jgi:putative ABC transport system permease protein
MRYMQQKELGFDRTHIVNIPYNVGLNDRFDAFRTELLSNSNIKNVGRSSRIPTGRLLDAMGARIKRSDTLEPANADIKFVSADQDFISTYGVKIVAGRDFSRDFSTDTGAFLLNEAAVKALSFKANDDAIGKDFGYGNRTGKVIGVFNDFHFESMHQKIVPLVLLVPRSANNYGNTSIKISGTNIPAALAHIEKTWKKFLPETPYQYTFLDENFERLYVSEERQKTIFTFFAFIAIFIACLGLFGLSAFAISQRIKEIGIRKVLGADVNTIVALLSKDFLKLVLLAAIIAFPIAWYAMDSWLQDFAYRIKVAWWVFIVAGIIAGIIAFLTISFQAIKAAIANPVKSLRSE